MAMMNPEIHRLLEEVKRELAEVRAEKSRLFPANPHPFAQPDKYPKDYSPEQIRRRNELNAQIETLENRIEELQDRLFSK